jgi:LacI family transcriptional regulator/LacI family repressor for deo operon, udp, cdd, tsx, nupC, and nupG
MVNVSPSTVSRVLNKHDKYASKEVRERILQIAQETGYVPNTSARDLQQMAASSNQKGNLACIFARSSDHYNDQFFFSIFNAIQAESNKNGYAIKYAISLGNSDLTSYSSMINHGSDIDGVFVLGRSANQEHMQINEIHSNVVYVGLNPQNAQIDQILCDGFKMAEKSVEYLYSLGHTKIGYIGEMQKETRFEGYLNKMKELELSAQFCIDAPLSIDGGYQGAKELLQSGPLPTAVFCCNDYVAIGVVRAITEAGLSVPNDISILGIDDIEMSRFMNPTLTTTHVPREEMGRFAVAMMLDRIRQGHTLPVKAEFPFHIVERETCAGVGGHAQ